jgi:hypothetical protein
MNSDDLMVGQRYVRIHLRDLRVVPFGDGPEEYAGERPGSEIKNFAVASPIPEPPPVIIAILLSSFPVIFLHADVAGVHSSPLHRTVRREPFANCTYWWVNDLTTIQAVFDVIG